jgi:Tol biopolymer transport system component
VVEEGIRPDWSPDGSALVFVRDRNLWTVSVDGTNELQITQSGQDEWPAWSRDGG